MEKAKKQLLRSQAYRLVTLGIIVERERSKLKRLVKRGVPYDDQEMIQALERFKAVDSEWKQLEAEHLRLREELECTSTEKDRHSK